MERNNTIFNNQSGFQAKSQNFNAPIYNNTYNVSNGTSTYRHTDEPDQGVYRHDKELRKSLTFPQRQMRRSAVIHPHLGTCQWIFQLESFRSWYNSSSGLLWVKGKPGSGKSTTMKHVHTRLQQKRLPDDETTVFLDFFFHARGGDLQKNPIGMLRSLLYQLYDQLASHCQPLMDAFDRKWIDFGSSSENVEWSQLELVEIFQMTVLEAAKSMSITVFIDALDEAGEQNAQDVAELFRDLNDKAANELDIRLKLCISSRHYPIYWSAQPTEICVENHNGHDIETFVNEKLSIGSLQLELSRNDIQLQDLVREILRRASGIFQWVSLVVNMVKSFVSRGETLFQVKQRLCRIPSDLEKLYEFIIRETIIPEYRRQSFRLFQWVCLSMRPLNVVTMGRMIAAMDVCTRSPQIGCYQSNDLKNDELTRKQITAWSGGLVEILPHILSRFAVVSVIHESVNEYLRSYGLKLLASLAGETCRLPGSSLAETDDVLQCCHKNLYQTCFTILAIDKPPQGMSQDRSAHPYNDPTACFGYICEYIFVHASKVTSWSYAGIEEHVTMLSIVFSRWSADWMHPYGSREDSRRGNCFWGQTTLLHRVSAANWVSCVQYLIGNGWDIEERDCFSQTPLHKATMCKGLDVLKLLLDSGADCLVKDSEQQTPLSIAAFRGSVDLARVMLGSQSAQKKGALAGLNRALVAAAGVGSIPMMELLISSGASIHAVDHCRLLFWFPAGWKCNAMQAACCSGHNHAIEFLLSKGFRVNSRFGPLGTALQAACSVVAPNQLETIQFLLNSGADVNVTGGFWGSALDAACLHYGKRYDLSVIKLLLEAGADANIATGFHGNVLLAVLAETVVQHAASELSKLLILVQTLVEAGADVNFCGSEGTNPLCLAISRGALGVCNLLLDRGADHSLCTDAGSTPLHYAAAYGYVDLVQRLIDEGAQLDARDKFGRTPLHYSLYHEAVDTTRVLMKSGADMSLLDGYGWTASDYTYPTQRCVGTSRFNGMFPVSSNRMTALRRSVVKVAQAILDARYVYVKPGLWEIGHCLTQLGDYSNASPPLRLRFRTVPLANCSLEFCSQRQPHCNYCPTWYISRTKTEVAYCRECRDGYTTMGLYVEEKHGCPLAYNFRYKADDSLFLAVCFCRSCRKDCPISNEEDNEQEIGEPVDAVSQGSDDEETDSTMPSVETPYIHPESPYRKPLSKKVKSWLQDLIEKYSQLVDNE